MTSTANLFHQPSHDREAAREARLAAAKAHRTASYETATVWSVVRVVPVVGRRPCAASLKA